MTTTSEIDEIARMLCEDFRAASVRRTGQPTARAWDACGSEGRDFWRARAQAFLSSL